nr:uncharacterized protein LOC104113064 [Nicotiana tomentosiformis]
MTIDDPEVKHMDLWVKVLSGGHCLQRLVYSERIRAVWRMIHVGKAFWSINSYALSLRLGLLHIEYMGSVVLILHSALYVQIQMMLREVISREQHRYQFLEI